MASKIILTACGFGCCPFKGGGSVVICVNLAFYLQYFVSVSSLVTRELFVFFMSNDCDYCLFLPRGAIGWSAVCDCDIFWPYLLTFWSFRCIKDPVSDDMVFS